ncbi:MAG: lysine-sensitive aspartokinase 3 [Gemmatimonadaceae bacterium]|nr:lysine-sensitive aspartokinase 3 [Gemmatimonadaceae bacterium]
MIVIKFGGTSVGDATAIDRAASIVRDRLPRQPIVVVSALGGATNALLAIAGQASEGQLILAIRGVEALRERHLAVAADLLSAGPMLDEVEAELSASFDELAHLAEALSTLGHATPRSRDAIAAMGEMLSSVLVVAAFRERGIAAEHVAATEVMITNDQFEKAEPRPDRIAEASQRVFRSLVAQGRVPVVGGYVGATEQGIVTTLGRGGSDYSASLFGAALGAEAIEIWTDVDGMLTADPRVVSGARLIERIRFDEASELASFGAKVLHPNTISPAVRLGIPVWIFNSRRPEGSGTQITFDAPRRPVTALAGKSGVTVLKVRSPRMLLQHGFLRMLFEIFDRHRTSVDVVATSEISVSVTVDDATHLDSLVVDLSQLGDISVERNRGIVAIVGAGLTESGTAMSQALSALGALRIHMLSLSASGINLTMIIDGDQVSNAMARLHEAFFPTSP